MEFEGQKNKALTMELIVVFKEKGHNGGCKDITSSRCHHWQFCLGLGDSLLQDLDSGIAHEGLAGAKGSSPKEVKAKGLGEELTPTTRSRKASTSVPWMRHRVVLEWVRI